MKVIGQDGRIAVPTAAAVGMFDGVHLGHRFVLSFLAAAAAARRLATAAITFSCHPRLALQPDCGMKLLMDSRRKLDALGATGIDYAVMLDFDAALARLSAREFLRMIRERYGVRLLVMGYDHRFGHDSAGCTFEDYAAFGAAEGVEVVRAPELQGAGHISSSAIRSAVLAGDVQRAAEMLSRPYSLGGTVVEGLKNGRLIGFPTANISLAGSPLAIPADGVYAVRAVLEDGTVYGGMLNIGTRPTIGSGLQRTVEVHILGFSGDLYGTRLTVEFVARVREERRMAGLEALRRQLLADRLEVMEILKQQ